VSTGRSHWRVERRYTADGKAAQHHAPGEGIRSFSSPWEQNPLSRRVAGIGYSKPRFSIRNDTTSLMKSITPDRCQQELQQCGGCDFAIEYTGGVRFRTAVFRQRGTIGIVMRRIPSDFLTFEQIRMPEAIKRLINRPRGLLLVTGPTGSGKTTSLASIINFINDNYDRHIITLEDRSSTFTSITKA